jgi:hypothetical protein
MDLTDTGFFSTRLRITMSVGEESPSTITPKAMGEN